MAFGFFGIFTVSMVYLGLLTVHNRRIAGRYFLAAVVFGMLGGGSTFLVVLGLIPFNTLTYHALELGIILEATLLALAVAHELRRHQQATLRAEHLASHDPLTALHNRRAFLERAQALWSTAERGHRPLSMILMDLDFFKQINDTHGHAVGDQALIQSAQLLYRACRAGDVLARWGGEEFILLLPETDIEQACAFAERLRQQIAEQEVPTEHRTLHLTASFGVAQRDVHANVEALIKSADVALYAAKHAGRNRVQRSRKG
jgi:diguanylate cyclase (GGDEF)-like protein